MKPRARARLITAGLFIAGISLATFFHGCSDSTEPKPTPVRYPETVERETVISNLVKTYKDANLAQFTKLLHEDYRWYNQELDVLNLGLDAFLTRDEEIATHEKFFRAAKKQYTEDPTKNLDRLELVIEDGTWLSISDIEGTPCEDCRETTRLYQLALVFVDQEKTLLAWGRVRFVVVSVPVGDTHLYRLIRAYDLMD